MNNDEYYIINRQAFCRYYIDAGPDISPGKFIWPPSGRPRRSGIKLENGNILDLWAYIAFIYSQECPKLLTYPSIWPVIFVCRVSGGSQFSHFEGNLRINEKFKVFCSWRNIDLHMQG